MEIDCDGDALIYYVVPLGSGACHTKAMSCFYRSIIAGPDLLPAPDKGKNEELPLIDVLVHQDIH